jgi:hypothetical protein
MNEMLRTTQGLQAPNKRASSLFLFAVISSQVRVGSNIQFIGRISSTMQCNGRLTRWQRFYDNYAKYIHVELIRSGEWRK